MYVLPARQRLRQRLAPVARADAKAGAGSPRQASAKLFGFVFLQSKGRGGMGYSSVRPLLVVVSTSCAWKEVKQIKHYHGYFDRVYMHLGLCTSAWCAYGCCLVSSLVFGLQTQAIGLFSVDCA